MQSHLCHVSRTCKSLETENRLLVLSAGRIEKLRRVIAKGHEVSFWGDDNVSKRTMVMAEQPVTILTMTSLYFKRMNCTIYELYLNKTVTKINKQIKGRHFSPILS